MFSRSRRTFGPSDRRPEVETGTRDDQVGVPCRVKVVTPGLALLLAMGLLWLARLSQSPPRPTAFATLDGFSGFVKALVLSADDRGIYGCSADGALITWNPGWSHAGIDGSRAVPIFKAAFGPHGSTLGIVAPEGGVSLWDPLHRRRWADIPQRTGRAGALAFSGDGATLATADGSGVRLWNVTRAIPSAGPQLDLRDVSSLAFAPYGRTLAVGTLDGNVQLWDSAQGRQDARFRAHPDNVTSLAFSDDGRLLATSSPHDRVARLWDGNAGGLLRELDGISQIQAVTFAPGGRELATAGFDGTVRLWDVATGKALWGLSERAGPVVALAFSADGSTLACGGVGVVRLYRLDLESGTTAR